MKAPSADALALALAVPAAATAFAHDVSLGLRALHALTALAAAVVAWRVWRTPHPWSAALLLGLAPPMLTVPEAAVTAAALLAWAAAPALGWLLAVPMAAHVPGHPIAWVPVLLAAAVLAVPGLAASRARRSAMPPRATATLAGAQPVVLAGAAVALPVLDRVGGLHAGYAWAALVLLVLAQGWAGLLAWQARAVAALAGPLAAGAALAAALGVAVLGLGRPLPFIALAIALLAPAVAPVLALATRRLPAMAQGPVQGAVALGAGLALQGLPV